MSISSDRDGTEIKFVTVRTGEVPGLALVEVDLRDDVELDVLAVDLALQVVVHQLLVGWVETETRREPHRRHA